MNQGSNDISRCDWISPRNCTSSKLNFCTIYYDSLSYPNGVPRLILIIISAHRQIWTRNIIIESVRVSFNQLFLDSLLESFLEILKRGRNEKHLRNDVKNPPEEFLRCFWSHFSRQINPELFLPTCLMPTIYRNNFWNDIRNNPRNNLRNVETTYSDKP
jgi:hypothetical protein